MPRAIVHASMIAAAVVMLATGCAGARARTNVLIPAMKQASHGIEADARRGVNTLPLDQHTANNATVTRFFSVIRSGDEDTIREDAIVSWGRVQELADIGIIDRLAKREIGVNGAESLRERVRNFDAALRAFILRSSPGF